MYLHEILLSYQNPNHPPRCSYDFLHYRVSKSGTTLKILSGYVSTLTYTYKYILSFVNIFHLRVSVRPCTHVFVLNIPIEYLPMRVSVLETFDRYEPSAQVCKSLSFPNFNIPTHTHTFILNFAFTHTLPHIFWTLQYLEHI